MVFLKRFTHETPRLSPGKTVAIKMKKSGNTTIKMKTAIKTIASAKIISGEINKRTNTDRQR